jgi:autophagy-related protein 9
MLFRLIDAIARFAAFVAGSFAAVLLLATVIDPDLFIHLEITPHRSVFFYLSVFGGILAIARGMIPEENRVFDSEVLMKAIVQYTHYLPDEWREQLHSKAVHTQFGELFAMKAVTFATELASVVLTPFILWFALPPCAPAIVDFFREFTVHVDGLGYVCSFAVFDFQRHGNVKVRFFYFFFTFSFRAYCITSAHVTYDSLVLRRKSPTRG